MVSSSTHLGTVGYRNGNQSRCEFGRGRLVDKIFGRSLRLMCCRKSSDAVTKFDTSLRGTSDLYSKVTQESHVKEDKKRTFFVDRPVIEDT